MEKYLSYICVLVFISLGFVQGYPMDDVCKLARRNNMDFNAEELGNHFEGDILSMPFVRRNGIIGKVFRWDTRVVPYTFSDDFTREQMDAIEGGLAEIERVSCIRFTKRSNETDYIYVRGEKNSCASEVGRQGGKQILNLAPSRPGCGCLKIGTIMHEFLHALGFFHMHTDVDRDKYTIIAWNNILEPSYVNFQKYSSAESYAFGIDYDFGSVMHYTRDAFTKNGADTIITYDPTVEMGQRTHLSNRDIIKLNLMYGCVS